MSQSEQPTHTIFSLQIITIILIIKVVYLVHLLFTYIFFYVCFTFLIKNMPCY